jgi:hypothetical protein
VGEQGCGKKIREGKENESIKVGPDLKGNRHEKSVLSNKHGGGRHWTSI